MESSISSNDKSLHCLNEEKQLTCNTWSWRLSFEARSGHPRLFVSLTMTHIHYERNSENDRIENPLIDESFLHWQTCTLMTYYDSANCSKRQNNATSILISLYCELKVTLLSRRGKGNRAVSGGSVIFFYRGREKVKGEWGGERVERGRDIFFRLSPDPSRQGDVSKANACLYLWYSPRLCETAIQLCAGHHSQFPREPWLLLPLIGLNISLYQLHCNPTVSYVCLVC